MNARDVASAPPASIAGDYDRQGRSESHLVDTRRKNVEGG